MTTSTNSSDTLTHDPRELLARAIATGGAVVAAVRTDQLDAPTPCSEMDVRAMLGHLVGVLGRIAALGRGDDLFTIVESPAPDDRWSEAWTEAAASAGDAWSDDEVLTRPMALPWVQGVGADLLASYLPELTVHTWDLATATGQHPEWDAAVVSAALEASDFLPGENRLALFEQISDDMGLDTVAVPFAEAVDVADDAPPIDRLVAWNGRNPHG